MGGSCSGSCGSEAVGGVGEGGQSSIEELVKAGTIKEASKLIGEGHVLMAVYWNCARSAEEYILGKLKKKETTGRKVGFSIP